jgi:hypothetical protein
MQNEYKEIVEQPFIEKEEWKKQEELEANSE